MYGLHRAVDLSALGQPDGAADDGRCGPPRLGAPGDRRDALLRLGPPGPQGLSARADRSQTGGKHADGRRRGPHHDDGPPRRPDSGILRHSRRRPLRQRHLRALHAQLEHPRPLDSRSRHGRSQAGQHLRQTVGDSHHHLAQGARKGQCGGQDDRHRRGGGTQYPDRGRHDRHGRHDLHGRRHADGERGQERPRCHHPPRAVGPGLRKDQCQQDKDLHKFTVLSVADIFADVIERVHNYKPISPVFFK